MATFKAALARTETDEIIRRLDENVIARSWKRELAEAEVARRTNAALAHSSQETSRRLGLHRAAEVKGWLVTVVLIVAAVLAAAAYIMN